MTYLEEAKFLQSVVSGMQHYLKRDIGDKKLHFKESEVTFRYEAIRGILIICKNDIDVLVKLWEKDAKVEK